jgi:hypothetical protein
MVLVVVEGHILGSDGSTAPVASFNVRLIVFLAHKVTLREKGCVCVCVCVWVCVCVGGTWKRGVIQQVQCET